MGNSWFPQLNYVLVPLFSLALTPFWQYTQTTSSAPFKKIGLIWSACFKYRGINGYFLWYKKLLSLCYYAVKMNIENIRLWNYKYGLWKQYFQGKIFLVLSWTVSSLISILPWRSIAQDKLLWKSFPQQQTG